MEKKWVRFVEDGQPRCGFITDTDGDVLTLNVGGGEFRTIHAGFVEAVDPVCLSRDAVRDFLHGVIGRDDLLPEGSPKVCVVADDVTYAPEVEDLEAALVRLERGAAARLDDAFHGDGFAHLFDLRIAWEADARHLVSLRAKGIASIFHGLAALPVNADVRAELPLLRRALEELKRQLSLSIEARDYADEDKIAYLRGWDLNDNDELEAASELEARVFRRFAEELAAKDNFEGLTALGFGCYCGNRMWPQDWFRARDALECIVAQDCDYRWAANALGYIYYYGRVNGGVPQYDRAYYYFSLAAFMDVTEATYKVCDMLMAGRGVPKNTRAAGEGYFRLYNITRRAFTGGEDWSKFADLALRLSNLAAQDEAWRDAACYAQEALHAVRLRRIARNDYGDDVVEARAQTALERALAAAGIVPQETARLSASLFGALACAPLKEGRRGELAIEADGQGNAEGVLRVQTEDDEAEDGDAPRMLVCVPEAGLCARVTSFRFRLIGLEEELEPGSRFRFVFDSAEGDRLFDERTRRALCIRAEAVEISREAVEKSAVMS